MLAWDGLAAVLLIVTGLRPAVVVLRPAPGDVVQVPIAVVLPIKTPYLAGSLDELQYLRGYAEGYADARRLHLVCRSRISDAWAKGWQAGHDAGKSRP